MTQLLQAAHRGWQKGNCQDRENYTSFSKRWPEPLHLGQVLLAVIDQLPLLATINANFSFLLSLCDRLLIGWEYAEMQGHRVNQVAK